MLLVGQAFAETISLFGQGVKLAIRFNSLLRKRFIKVANQKLLLCPCFRVIPTILSIIMLAGLGSKDKAKPKHS